MDRRVVITGTGMISALGDEPALVHAALCDGRTGIAPVRLFDTPGCRCKVGAEVVDFAPQEYLGEANMRPLDRTSRLVAAAAQRALGASGWSTAMRAEQAVGMVLGTMFCSVHTISEFDRRGLTAGPDYVKPLDFANTVINAAAGQTAIWHDLRGINSTIATGVSSGLQAIGYAADLIRSGRAVALLAGGAEEMCYESYFGFDRAGLLCGSRSDVGNGKRESEFSVPFDARRNGFAVGEGAAFLMLEERQAAERRGAILLGEIRGHGRRFDPSCGVDSTAAIGSIERAIDQALTESAIAADRVDAVSAGANGSVREDAHEAAAIAKVFADRAATLPVTANKALMGEALGASGGLQAVAAIESIRASALPGTCGLEQTEPGFPLGAVGPDVREFEMHNVLLNSVGFDGNCCALVLAREDAT